MTASPLGDLLERIAGEWLGLTADPVIGSAIAGVTEGDASGEESVAAHLQRTVASGLAGTSSSGFTSAQALYSSRLAWGRSYSGASSASG